MLCSAVSLCHRGGNQSCTRQTTHISAKSAQCEEPNQAQPTQIFLGGDAETNIRK